MPAGFYYKTFMWPKRFWMRYEHFIRKASGLGVAPDDPDPDVYDKMNAHCDVLVVGGGPAGLAAAWAAGRAGARVILADEQQEFGGSLLVRARGQGSRARRVDRWRRAGGVGRADRRRVAGDARRAIASAQHRVRLPRPQLPDDRASGAPITCRPASATARASASGACAPNEVVLATGAIERPLVFANNDRPGVMLASAVSAYLNRYGVGAGSRAVVFTNNDSAYRTAFDLAAAGIAVAAVVDARRTTDGALPERARLAGHHGDRQRRRRRRRGREAGRARWK